MNNLKKITYLVFMLYLLLICMSVGYSEQISKAVRYRADFSPLGSGFSKEYLVPSFAITDDWPLYLRFNFQLNPGQVIAELNGEIILDPDNRTITIRGTEGEFLTNGGIIFTGKLVGDFEILGWHVSHEWDIPKFPQINQSWDDADEFQSLLLDETNPAEVEAKLRALVTVTISTIDIAKLIIDGLTGGGTQAVPKAVINKIKDWLDAGIKINGGLSSELALYGEAISVNGESILTEEQSISAPGLDLSLNSYEVNSEYLEHLTFNLNALISTDLYAVLAPPLLGPIWSTSVELVEKEIPLLPADFRGDLDFETTPNPIVFPIDGTPANPAPQPVGSIDARSLTVGGSATTVDVSPYFSDPDDTLTYSALSNNGWVVTVARSGSQVTITPRNQGSAEIVVRATDSGGSTTTQRFTATVSGHSCTYTLSQSTKNVPATGESISIDVTTAANCIWIAWSDNAFLSVNPLWSTGSGTVTVRVDENTNVSNRTGSVTIADQTFTVTQAAQSTPAAQLDLAIQAFEVSKATVTPGESFTLSVTVNNNGPGNSDDIGISYYHSSIEGLSPQDRTRWQGTVWVDALASGESVTKSIELDAPSDSGTYYYGAFLVGSSDDTNIHNNVATEVGVTVSGSDLNTGTEFNIPDPNLRAKIETALNKQPGDPITAAEMATLTRLDARNANISDLTGLKFAINLTSLDLEGNQLTILPTGVFEGLSKLTYLDLNANPLTTIKTDAFKSLSSLTTLILDFHQLTTIEGGAFKGLINLQKLDLEGNRLTILPTGVFEGLSKLTSLNLNNNPLAAIEAGAFNGLSSLTTLVLDFHQLTTIEGGAFKGLSNLQTLDLEGNKITTLYSGVFEGLSRVTKLNLNRNPLTTIEGGAFNSLSSLQTLDLSSRGLTIIENGTFSGLSSLTTLNLNGNPLKTIETNAFNGLSSLQTLILDFHQLTTIEAGAFKGLSNLTTLDLEGNKITTLPTGMFEGLSRVTYLNLNANPLTTIKTDAFKSLSSLTTLVLDFHKLKTIETNAFRGLSNLTKLDLEGNQLTTLPTGVFEGLSKLTSLNLNRNPLTTIKADAFKSLPGLTTLILDFHQLTTIETNAFNGLTNLQTLDLEGNQLATLSTGVFNGLSNLTSLNLNRNPLTTIKTDAFRSLSGLTTLILDFHQLTTIEGGAFKGLSNLTTLDLEGNRLTTLPTGVFEGLSSLTSLNLNRNPGSPFTLTLKLVRTDTTDLTTPGPATMVVKLDQGAPFEMTASLSVEGGTLSATTATIARGKTESESITVAQSGIGSVTISLEDAPGIPSGYYGLQMDVGDSLVLFGPGSIPTQLVKISGDDQRATPGTALASPLIVEVRDAENRGVQSIDVTFAVTAGGGTLSETTVTTNANGRAESTLTLGPNLGANTVSVSAAGISQSVTFNAVATPPETKVMVIEGTITNKDGTLAEAGLHITVTIGSNTQTGVSEGAGVYRVTLINPLEVLARSLDTVEVQVVRQATGESARQTVQLSSEQIIAQSATIDLEFSIAEYLLSVPVGISLIHVPMKVKSVDGVSKTIKSVGDLYDALGGAATVSLLITYDPNAQRWDSYLGAQDKGKPADKALTDDLGIITSMKAPASIRLSGDALGTNGSSSITLQKGLNLVGVPLKDSRITKVSDLLALDGIRDNVSVIIGSDTGEFKLVTQAGDPGDVELTGGQSFIMTAREMATVAITGDAWANAPGTTAAPPRALTGIQVAESTPILAVTGSIVSPVDGASLPRLLGSRFRVTIKNLSTGKADTAVTDDDSVGYQLTFVELETGRAAQIGDTLEISAQSPNPLVGIQPLRYVITAADVKRGHIQLTELVAYEIPAKTELLLNYPNPFNPETWIPYRLASDSDVTLTIYNTKGAVVRRFDLGHQPAGFYTARAQAAYWNGRNAHGESVASGVYFYQLRAGNYSALRRMVILK